MFAKLARRFNVGFLLVVLTLGLATGTVFAQDGHAADDGHGHGAVAAETHGATPVAGSADDHSKDGHDDHADGGHHKVKSAFAPHAGSFFNGIARSIFGGDTPVAVGADHEPLTAEERAAATEVHFNNVDYDYIVIAYVLMALFAVAAIAAAKKGRIRPEGKAGSWANAFEAAVEGFQNYLIGVMGDSLARKYTPLIASFFFTILLFNWIGLVPGWIAPTSNPNVPFAFALVSFIMVHAIAIKETGFKSWFMHLVGEPVWMGPLMFPLHLIGELVKPASLALRLLGNVFGEEMVIAKLIGLGILASASLGLPIPLLPIQLPILFLGVLFGFLQAVVFSTLLAIYIAILGTHHDDHDEHNAHGHVEKVHVHGHTEYIGHPSETSVA